MPASSPERAERTRKFQLVNDAYFTLSNPSRRKEYDEQWRKHSSSSTTGGDPFAQAAGDAYSWAWNFFTSKAARSSSQNQRQQHQQTREETEEWQFEDIFDEMMRDEGLAGGNTLPTGSFWSCVGGISGGALGFIVANVPGMVAGAVAGNRLGAVRDAKGKSVYSVFQELAPDDRAKVLSQLAAKVLSHAVAS